MSNFKIRGGGKKKTHAIFTPPRVIAQRLDVYGSGYQIIRDERADDEGNITYTRIVSISR